jgi:hypothetical protein
MRFTFSIILLGLLTMYFLRQRTFPQLVPRPQKNVDLAMLETPGRLELFTFRLLRYTISFRDINRTFHAFERRFLTHQIEVRLKRF